MSGHTSVLVYDSLNQSLLLGTLGNNGVNTAYALHNVTNPIGTFYLSLARYNTSDAPPATLKVVVSSINDTEANYSVYTSPKSGTFYQAAIESSYSETNRNPICHRAGGTGRCDNVITNWDWWMCFACCAATSCYANGDGVIVPVQQ